MTRSFTDWWNTLTIDLKQKARQKQPKAKNRTPEFSNTKGVDRTCMNVVETEIPLNGLAKTFVYKEGNSTCIIEFSLISMARLSGAR